MPVRLNGTGQQLYVGLMSGTSMDGIDALVVDFSQPRPELLGHLYVPWPDSVKERLKVLAHPGENEIERLGIADIEVANQFSQAVNRLLEETGILATHIRAIGSHGQTIRHRPDAALPFTLQIGDPNRIAELTGITVIADFRRRDMAAGGEGAPLAPAFHAAVFRDQSENRAVLNLGGIANITVLPSDSSSGVRGFDTGPANTLMDSWITHCQKQPFDENGNWAASGRIIPGMLENLLSDPYFSRPAPKSTGPELFNLEWLQQRQPGLDQLRPADVQATLCALTSESIKRALQTYAPDCQRLICCGGGTRNRTLMQQLKSGLGNIEVESTSSLGIDPERIESMAFAWLARQTLEGAAGNLPEVTGARHPRILGGIYQA